MSPGGRWRKATASFRTVAGVVLIGGALWGGWMITASLRENSPHMPAVAKAVPVRPPELRTTQAGVLNDAWLARTLALPRRVALMELNLEELRTRLLADRQVLSANLTRQFPDRLIVEVTEREPVARLRVGATGRPRDLLVARDGVMFAGSGYDSAMLESLPWLGGISVVAQGEGFRPVARMEEVSELLSRAQFAARELYRQWKIVSLARLDSDNEIEVTMQDNTTVVFDAKSAFFGQLANLDFMMEKLERVPRAGARIDLSLGREVPVMIIPLEAAGVAPARPAPSPSSFLPRFLNSQPNIKREL